MAIYKSSLKKVGETIGLQKMETPEKLKNAQELTSKEQKQAETYMIRDTQIVLEAIKKTQKQAKTRRNKKKMISTQRLLLIVIMVNILVGVTTAQGGIWHNPHEYTTTQVTVEQALMEEGRSEITDTDTLFGGAKTQGDIGEQTIGDSISWGAFIVDAFTRGIWPFSIGEDQVNTSTEKILVRMLQLFRSLMIPLLILEIYFIIKNRKNT